MTPDSELLRRYAETKSEAAFAELVRRHVNLVYSAALRQVNGDAHLAQDVAQTVFTDLARKAGSLARREVLTGWLYTSAHFAAAKAVRTEQRRHAREQEAHNMRETLHTPAPEPDWEKLRPVLDEVMHELKESDREAILLRYFENQPFAEIGEKFGLNENAARMRVERALEKLRGFLASRGVTTAVALSTVISANAVQIAPAGLAVTLTGASLAAAGMGTLLNFMTLTKLKLGLSALVVAGAATALVVQHQAQVKLHEENESLRQQISQLQSKNGRLSNLVAQANRSLSDDQLNELLKLRGEVGMLRQQTNELGSLLRGNPLRPNLSPHAPIPQDPNVAARFSLHTMNIVGAAKQMVFGFGIYAQGHNGQYPTNFDQLEGDKYFPTNFPDTDGMKIGFDNFEFVNAGLVSGNTPDKIMLRERIPRQGPDGNWVRVYGMADGSVQVHVSADGNFDDYEKDRMASPPNQ